MAFLILDFNSCSFEICKDRIWKIPSKVPDSSPTFIILTNMFEKILGYLAIASDKFSPLFIFSLISIKALFKTLPFAYIDKISNIFTKDNPVENIIPKFLTIISFWVEETPKKGIEMSKFSFAFFSSMLALIKIIPWLLRAWANWLSFEAFIIPVSVFPSKFLAM